MYARVLTIDPLPEAGGYESLRGIFVALRGLESKGFYLGETTEVFLQRRRFFCSYTCSPHLDYRVSRLPRALFRGLSGRCPDPAEITPRSHQIYPTATFPEGLGRPSVQTPTVWWVKGFGAPAGIGRILIFSVGAKLTEAWETLPIPAGMRSFPVTNSERNEPMTLSGLLRKQQSRKERLLQEPPQGDSADTRGFREGRQGRCERPDRPGQWNRIRCYRVHPYWTDNLKYVH
jgi:hypothetical protein